MLRKRASGPSTLLTKRSAKIASSGISFTPETMIIGNCGRQGSHDLCQLSADHTGHHLIGEDEIDVMLIEQVQCLGRGRQQTEP